MDNKNIVVDSGFDSGDDNRLQNAMLENLEKSYKEKLALGHMDEAKHIQEDIEALRAHQTHDHKHDPFDTTPDDLDVE